jgi:very-short-patch-repair endonuclease
VATSFALGPFIVDFVCLEARLVVEVDGGQHNEEEGLAYDRQRSDRLKNQGFRVLRFWDDEVLRELAAVTQAIANALAQK